MKRLANIFWLGTKELRSLQRDTVLVLFVIYAFTFAIYTQAKGTSSEVHNASIAFVDEDQSALSKRLFESFYPPRFNEIALAKVWANGLVVLVAVTASLFLVVRTLLAVPIAGSPALFLVGVVLYLFFGTALGIFLGTITRSMAQFALLIILLIIVLQLLSGGNTPIESQPEWMQRLTLVLPSRHFVAFSQAIIYRGAGMETVWPQFLAVTGIGLVFFVLSLRLFRESIAVTR